MDDGDDYYRTMKVITLLIICCAYADSSCVAEPLAWSSSVLLFMIVLYTRQKRREKTKRSVVSDSPLSTGALPSYSFLTTLSKEERIPEGGAP